LKIWAPFVETFTNIIGNYIENVNSVNLEADKNLQQFKAIPEKDKLMKLKALGNNGFYVNAFVPPHSIFISDDIYIITIEAAGVTQLQAIKGKLENGYFYIHFKGEKALPVMENGLKIVKNYIPYSSRVLLEFEVPDLYNVEEIDNIIFKPDVNGVYNVKIMKSSGLYIINEDADPVYEQRHEEEERIKQEELRKIQEEDRKKQEELRKMQELRKKQEEERKKQEELRKIQEEERKMQEELRKKQEEDRKVPPLNLTNSDTSQEVCRSGRQLPPPPAGSKPFDNLARRNSIVRIPQDTTPPPHPSIKFSASPIKMQPSTTTPKQKPMSSYRN